MPHVRRWGSRARFGSLLVVLATAALLTSTFAAHAQTSSDDTSALRTQADALSTRYFATLTRVQSLDDEIARSQQQVDELSARAKAARDAARARALVAYTTSGTQLSALVDGQGTLDSARRAHLIDRVNAKDEHTFATLTKTTKALRKQQQQLRDARSAQSSALDDLKTQGAAIDAKLASAEAQARATAAAQATTTTSAAPAASPSVTTATTAAPRVAAPTTTTAPPPPAPTAPAYTPAAGTSSHHDDPFLTCVRRRESGGNYGAVNPAGPYLGAYQFLQATWNVTAAHAGRSDLVGVPANIASAYDQDEMAWALYQWQGPGPWGGGC